MYANRGRVRRGADFSDLRIVGVQRFIPGLVVIHPTIHIRDEILFRRLPEQLPARNPVGRRGAHVRFNPALHELPAKFIRQFKVLNDARLDRTLGHLIKPTHQLAVVASFNNRLQRSNRLFKAFQFKCHAWFSCGRQHAPARSFVSPSSSFRLLRCQLGFELFDGWQAAFQALRQRLHDLRLPLRHANRFVKAAQRVLHNELVF